MELDQTVQYSRCPANDPVAVFPGTLKTAMLSSSGGGRSLNQFALVSYIPDPLGAFLDRLRLDLTPHCNPHAHVTVLPPRPIANDCDLKILTATLEREGRLALPFEVVLGDIQIFPVTNVIYLGLARGERELHALHENLNAGQLEYDGPFPYHPHITVAQELTQEQAEELAKIARARWQAWEGARRFTVECLSFVQNVAPSMWVDLARIPLAQPVGALR
jgi:2'-5' RNA ligase